MSLSRNRIPVDFFVTRGQGQSDITHHAGAYHLALRQARIERANIMTYSSILPRGANQIDQQTYRITQGEVLESIMAVASCGYGETATAALGWSWLLDGNGDRHGGIVAEYNGPLLPHLAKPHVEEMLDELFVNGFEQDLFEREKPHVITEHVTPTKQHGCALVAMCFTSFDEVPW